MVVYRKIKCIVVSSFVFLFLLISFVIVGIVGGLQFSFFCGFVSFTTFVVRLSDDLFDLLPRSGLSSDDFDFGDRLLCRLSDFIRCLPDHLAQVSLQRLQSSIDFFCYCNGFVPFCLEFRIILVDDHWSDGY